MTTGASDGLHLTQAHTNGAWTLSVT